MTLSEVRAKFLAYYKTQGHTVLPSAPLVPDNDPTTLFTGSGMQPLVPYLLGQKHPAGTRLANSQKSFRSGDIEDVGDNRHTTFFEMLGNWSLGDYFKEKQIPWVFGFLTKEVGLDPQRIYVTVFSGDEKNGVPRDMEAVALWKKLFAEKGIDAKDVEILTESRGGEVGMQGGRIFYYDTKKNWWSRAGVPEKMPTGEPGGPDSEMFYEFTAITHDEKFGKHCHPNCDCGRFMEIGNSVFMEYRKVANGFEKLPQRNVDFGGGLERITAASLDNPDVFRIDAFSGIISEIEKLSGKKYEENLRAFRIVADHLRASVFLIADGVNPSNTDQGYFVRRLLRRAVRYGNDLGIQSLSVLVPIIIATYKDHYQNLSEKQSLISEEIVREEEKFRKTLSSGLKEFQKIAEKTEKVSDTISGKDTFILFSSYGFPLELIIELAAQNPVKDLFVDTKVFEEEMKKHQDLSRAGSEAKFKGGLSGHGETETKYHTATHLLHQALREVLGTHVEQKGSNITPERLRFDFTHSAKMTDEEKKRVEEIVNAKIKAALPVTRVELPKIEAEKTGALHFFGDKYGDTVSVYYIGDSIDSAFSKEFCGGPHVKNTSEIGTFKIQKEEACSAGVRRIKAVIGSV